MASSISKNIGPSLVDAICFDKKDFKEEFKKYYNLKSNIELNLGDEKLKEKLMSWFNDSKIVESILYLSKIDPKEKIYNMNNKIIEELSGYNKGISGFYIVEDIFLIEDNNEVIVFILGNNE